jgi:peptidoglycan/xylan/chitin deacetylase (PgdA/CDA1 family)
VTVLCYHSVQSCWESPLAVEPDAFAQQAAWLRARRRVLPMRTALERLDGGGRLPRGEAVLTFDDGFAALHDQALPVLTRERLPATVFLVAQTLTERGQPVDWVDTPGTEPLRTLTRDQVLEMQDVGVDFQSHSWAHHDLTQLTESECERDLRDSREFLAEVLGRPVTLLAYPRGRHSPHVRRAAARAGFSHAFALPERAEEVDAYAIPRVGIFRGNGQLALRIKAARPYLRLRHSERVTRGARAVQYVARRVRPPGR